MNYLEEIAAKKQTRAATNQRQEDRQSSKADIDSIIQQLKEVQMASLLGNNQKPSIVLTDSTDLGEHISGLGDKIIEVLNAVKDDKSVAQQISGITTMVADFKSLITSVQTVSKQQSDRVCASIESLKKAVAEQKPIIVPAPSVRLQERALDLTPLMDKLDELLTPKVVEASFSMNDYRAQDLDNANGVQFIGFTDMHDGWYIMENNTENNTIRYAFGNGDYNEAWDQHYGLTYTTLSKAINAIRS